PSHARSRPDQAASHHDRYRPRDSNPRRRGDTAAAPGVRRARPGAEGSADALHRMQLRARVARARGGGGARPSLREAYAVALFRMPAMRPHLLGRDALAADARGPARFVRDILRRLVAGELSEDDALAELRRLQLDEFGGRARLDLGRYLRRGVPEVVLASGKPAREAARLVIAMAERQGQGLISRMTDGHASALAEAASAAGMQLVRYDASARALREGFSPEAVAARVGIMTAGTSDIPAASEARMVVEACGVEARLE